RARACQNPAPPPGPNHRGRRNAHRTDFLAAPAQARSMGQIARVIEALQCGCEHRAHRPWIHRTVSVPADRAVDGAVIKTGAATNAAKHVLEYPAKHIA